MAFLESKEDYEALGLTPPESIQHGTEGGLELARALSQHTCLWQQRGNHIWCHQGPHEHGKLVEPHKILIGTSDEGAPLFKEIDNSSLLGDSKTSEQLGVDRA